MFPNDWVEGNRNVCVRHEAWGQVWRQLITALITDAVCVPWELPSRAQPETLNNEFPCVPPPRQLESSPAVCQSIPVLDWLKRGLISPFSRISMLK